MKEGIIFDIQHFCMDDGPGIRTTVFMKGCPLRCLWCHNAEGLTARRQLAFTRENCTYCGRCAQVCEHGGHLLEQEQPVHQICREDCVACGKCAESCPAEALRIYGKKMSVEEVLEEVEKDRLFYETSEGGITLSGGEPLAQSGFVLELLGRAKETGLHTCMETSGFCTEEVIRQAAEVTDLFLFDIKETDPVLHEKFTGVENAQILQNLQVLAEQNKPVILRCPIIPGCNEREEHFQKLAGLANTLGNVKEIHLEPYHPFGVDKYEKLGMEAPYQNQEFMPEERIREWKAFLQTLTAVYVKVS